MSFMHVMHVIDSLHGGGAETSLIELVPGLARRGVKSSLVALLPDDGGLEDKVNGLGITCIRLKRRDPLGLTLELRDAIRSEGPDLLHTTLLFSDLVGRIAAQTTRTPVVTTLANGDYGPEHRARSSHGSWSVRAVQIAEMVTAPLTKRFHAVSEHVAKVMSHRLKIPQSRIEVVYPGRDPAKLGAPTADRRLRVRAALSIGPRAPLVLSVARLDQQKGVDTTISAFRRLLVQIPDAVLLIAGRPGNAATVVEAEAQRTPSVRLLGHRTDVPDLMCAADVLSHPSRWEGLGSTFVEAMALRLPMVLSDIPSIAEAIGDVGWPLVPPDDAQAVADNLASVLRDGELNDTRRDAGQKRFMTLFTEEAASDNMAEFYKGVFRDTRRRP
jgi:glycosyltransferase involved in cell wall biosynthesis